MKNEVCEILLKPTVRPKGVFIGGEIGSGKIEEVNVFAKYYRLPIYEWKDGKILEL